MRARHVFRAARPDAVLEAEGGAVLAGPVRPVRPVGHEGHALLHRRPRLGDEQVRRHPAEIDMAVRGDTFVLHDGSSHGWR